MLGAQSLERGDHRFLTHLHSIGDHSRGLFEAEASVAVSATHALKNVEIVTIGHRVSSLVVRIARTRNFFVTIQQIGFPDPKSRPSEL